MIAISIFQGWYRGANAAAIEAQGAKKSVDTTLPDFLTENEFDPADAAGITDVLQETGCCRLGGGASPEFTIALRVPA